MSICLPRGLHGKLEQQVEEEKGTFHMFYLHILDLKTLNETFSFQEIVISQLRTCFGKKLATKSSYSAMFTSKL